MPRGDKGFVGRSDEGITGLTDSERQAARFGTATTNMFVQLRKNDVPFFG